MLPRWTTLRSSVLVLLLVSAVPASGQQRDTANQVIPLSPVVVTATRVEVPATTAATMVLSGDSLQARGVTHLVDALRDVPGLTIARTGSFGGTTSLYTRGGQNNYTRVLVDGIPLNEPGGAFDFAHLTTNGIERVEIVRGPSSVLYGTDAVSGVIQLFTRAGSGGPHWDASIQTGTYGTIDLSAGLRGGTETARYGVTVAHHETDGIHEFNSEYRNSAVRGVVRLQPTPITDAGITLHYLDDEVGVPTDGAGRVVDRNAKNFGERLAFGIDVGHHLSSRVRGKLLLAIHSRNGGFDDAADGPADSLGFFAFRSLDRVDRRSADLRLDVDLTPSMVVTGGVTVEDQRQRSFNESDSEFGPSNGTFEADRSNSALYSQLVGAAGPLTWQLGGRVDENSAFGSFWTYRAGVAYAIANRTRLRASFGSAFREPTFFENFAQGFVRGNPDLEPERARSWEVGVTHQWLGTGARMSATWFTQRYRNMIDYTFSTAQPGDPNYFNVAVARSRGLEFEASANLTRKLGVRSSYTYLDARVLTPGFDSTALGTFRADQSLLRRPEHTVEAGFTLSPTTRTTFDVRARRVGERDDLDFENSARVVLPAYTVVNASAQWRVLRSESPARSLMLGVRVANLLDESFEEVFGYATPGRTLLVSLHTAF